MEPTLAKVHIGSGTVYLKDWLNVDIKSPTTFLAHERPDLVSKSITEEADYYGRIKIDDLSKFIAGPKTKETVCDIYGSFQDIPIESGAAFEILSRQVWEHLSLTEAKGALAECRLALAKKGIIRIDVPDNHETLKLYLKTQNPFYARHFFGPQQKGAWGSHMMSYTRDSLRNLFADHGFKFVAEELNIHDYPAFCLRFMKV